jgi:hypothetical protein
MAPFFRAFPHTPFAKLFLQFLYAVRIGIIFFDSEAKKLFRLFVVRESFGKKFPRIKRKNFQRTLCAPQNKMQGGGIFRLMAKSQGNGAFNRVQYIPQRVCISHTSYSR